MPTPLPVGVRVALIVILPLLTYWSTVNMPVGTVNWISTLNNFSWLASGLYFIFYLPLRGLQLRHWIPRLLAALVGIALFLTGFQAASAYRTAKREAQKVPAGQEQPRQEPITKTRAFELVEQQPEVKALKDQLGARFVIVMIAETRQDFLMGVGESQRFDLQYRVTKAKGEVIKQ